MEEKKGSWKRKLLLLFVLLVTAVLVILPFVLDRISEKAGDEASLVSAAVMRGDIRRTVSGAGTVGAKDAVSVTIPSDIVLTGYAVKDGAVVYAGDPVAFVDKVSVYKLIASLGEELDKITDEIAEVQNTWASTYISSNVAGTVTAVYAQDGDDIRKVMAEHGALAEITLENGTVLKVSETSGTVLSVFVSEGDAVFVNASLFSVSDVETMGEYGALVLRHHKIEDQLAQLFQMYRDGYVPAPADGMIAGTDETLIKKLSAGENDGIGIDLLTYSQPLDGVFSLQKLAFGDTGTATEYISSTIVESPDSSGQGVVSGVYGTVDLSAFPGAKSGDTVFMREDSTYVTGPDGEEYLADVQYTVLLVEEQKDDEKEGEGSSSKGGSGGGAATGAGTATGAAGTSSGSAEAAAASLSTKGIASVVPMDEALISVSIDELDILSLHVGDTAQVTIDALPGRAFDGVVTAVNTGRSNSGGNSKYIAEVTVPRTADMFDGMNASCLVTIETLRDVLTVPAAALCDAGGVQMVYTALSRDKSELSNPVPVEYGFSDGETLEILSGLKEGDTVWYKIYDTPEYSAPKARSSGGLGSLMGGVRRALR